MAEVAGLEPIGAVRRTQVGREATEPMREDIRLLGAILGDTIREQNGEAVFDLVERARVESFRVRRSEIDRTDLAGMFDGIDIHRAIPVIRAFTHFALLANVAEDTTASGAERSMSPRVNHRRTAAWPPPTPNSTPSTKIRPPSPTRSHPTETRRRTVFDTQHRITELMRLRLHGHTSTDDGRDIEHELRRHILTLWQTALTSKWSCCGATGPATTTNWSSAASCSR